jgi:hypothetical protein
VCDQSSAVLQSASECTSLCIFIKKLFRSTAMEPENLEDLVQDSRALALNDVPYDRDLRWCNKPSKARPRPQPNTSNRLFNQVACWCYACACIICLWQIVSITHNTEEYERLDKHYKVLLRCSPMATHTHAYTPYIRTDIPYIYAFRYTHISVLEQIDICRTHFHT